MLSVRALKVLQHAGWYPGREIDPQLIRSAYERYGIEPLPSAVEFLKQFGNLRLNELPNPPPPGATDWCMFDFALAAVGGQALFQEYEVPVGERLTPIGFVRRQHVRLYMSESGRVCGAFEDFLFMFGGSGADAINALCEGREEREIPYTRPEGMMIDWKKCV